MNCRLFDDNEHVNLVQYRLYCSKYHYICEQKVKDQGESKLIVQIGAGKPSKLIEIDYHSDF